jgi:hypothetical protein
MPHENSAIISVPQFGTKTLPNLEEAASDENVSSSGQEALLVEFCVEVFNAYLGNILFTLFLVLC